MNWLRWIVWGHVWILWLAIGSKTVRIVSRIIVVARWRNRRRRNTSSGDKLNRSVGWLVSLLCSNNPQSILLFDSPAPADAANNDYHENNDCSNTAADDSPDCTGTQSFAALTVVIVALVVVAAVGVVVAYGTAAVVVVAVVVAIIGKEIVATHILINK